jgi:hypothetical protein
MINESSTYKLIKSTVMKYPLIIALFVLVLGISTSSFAQHHPFVPSDFKIPPTLENQHFRVRMLTVHDVVKDYDAVMTSIDHLQGVFGPHSKWPSKELTLEQDLIDLGWHQKEFQKRSSFAYTVMNKDESQCLGCVYIDPCPKMGYDAKVYLWVRRSELKKGLDSILFEAVKNWIEQEWPFKKVAYPGREISWNKWEQLR